MSNAITLPIGPNFNLVAAVESAKQQLYAQGFQVSGIPMGDRAQR